MYRIPIGSVVEQFVNFLQDNYGGFFEAIADVIEGFMGWTQTLLLSLPPLVFVIALGILAYVLVNWKISLFTFGSLVLVFYMGIWVYFIQTFVLVLVAAIISLAIGLPIGVLISRYKKLDKVITPILDFMQTMPPFVYLIPAALLFGTGEVPGIIATVIFSMPPAIRMTKLGLDQVPDELQEVGHSFGLNGIQMLYKIRLPMALPSIMAGINQSIMLALSMVVIASMIGAEGLGSQVLTGIQRLEIGVGFEAGLGVVILAVILDRLTGSIKLNRNKE